MPRECVLAIETSVETGSVALMRDGEVVIEQSFLAGRKPSAGLWPALEAVMAEVQAQSDLLSAIVVGVGPGSYNGTRIGIAAAQGLALVHECGIAPICSFEGVALSQPQALAIGDARRGSFSLQALAQGRLDGDFSLVSKEGLAMAIEEASERGEEIFSFDESGRFPLAEELQRCIARHQSQAGLLAKAFASRTAAEQEELFKLTAEPFYLRDPHITVGKRRSLLDR